MSAERLWSGASLRDIFAGQAMHAELVTCGVPGEACDALLDAASAAGCTPEDKVAANAYAMADAMLRAREVQP
ncbi:MAG: hypothetical protein ACTHJ9_05345 [Rhodanobacter sp.]